MYSRPENGSSREIPLAIEEAVLEILEGPDELVDRVLDRLLARVPDHAPAIRRWLTSIRGPPGGSSPETEP